VETDLNKVLLIDEDTDSAKNARMILELSGLLVDVEHDGKKGLSKALSEKYDMIILEMKYKNINGLDILKKVKSEKKIPVMFLSSCCEEMDICSAFFAGADDYVTKPFNVNILAARAHAHMDLYDALLGISKKKQKVIEHKGIRIEKTARRVFVDGVEKNFTSKEFDLLTFLAEHPNRVYAKEELFREIWDMDSVGDIATVTVHIKKIREKVEKDSSKPQYIETIWGVGYRFKV